MELRIEEIARCLDLPVQKVERWVRQGRIPLVMRGEACVFNRDALERWASDHHLLLRLGSDKAAACLQAECPPTLSAAMQSGGVHHGIQGDDVPSTLAAAVNRLGFISPDDQRLLLEKLIERERLTSTGIGNGVAIPHPRDPLAVISNTPRIATFFLNHPVDFRAIDDQPVHVLFLVLCPGVKIHLHLLSRLSFCLRMGDFVALLKNRPTAEALFRKVADVEGPLDAAGRPG
ncbi:MAG: PTS sugar transporter subunit IIA [Desulfobacterales bacterium]